MNLICCENCGVVLNKNHLFIPDIYDDDGYRIEEVSKWQNHTLFPIVPCPVCKANTIIKE